MASLSGLHLRSRLQKRLLMPRMRLIRLVVCDVDGVLTDGGLHYDEDGPVEKRFDVPDGLAVRMLQRAGITVALLSGGRSGAIEQRARHLDIEHCRTGVGDKQSGLEQLRSELAMTREQTAFLGDDLNDLVVRPVSGLLITPADASRGLRRQADLVLSSRGGKGELLEFTEVLLNSSGSFDLAYSRGWSEVNDTNGA
jgi:3-deoxy-D-manno-octulosonate 8-phosphate phosphatase (KDO 8-P phosphatase)